MKIYIFSLLIFNIYCGDYKNLLYDLWNEGINILGKHSNSSIIYYDIIENNNCFDGIENLLLYKNMKLLDRVISDSGKSLSDMGMEWSCRKNNLSYFLLNNIVDIDEFFSKEPHDVELYKFIQQNQFYTGICFLKECENFYRNFFNSKMNKEFYDYLSETGIIDLQITFPQTLEYESNAFIIILWILLGCILLKIIFSLVGNYYFKKYNVVKNEVSMEFTECYSRMDESFRGSLIIENTRRKQLLYKFYKIISLKSNLKNIYYLKTKFFNDTGMEIICFLRFIIILILTFNHNVYTLLRSPHREYSSYSFISSPLFSIVKYSTFSIEAWICLDGLILAYKLMSYLKKTNDYSFKSFMYFSFSYISKVIVFFLILYIFYLSFGDLGTLIGKTTSFDLFYRNRYDRVCKSDPIYLLIPFYIQYFSGEDVSCFRHVYMYINEFICINITIMIFYLCMRFKSKIIEILSVLSLIIIFLSNIFRFDTEILKQSNYNIFLFLGDNLNYQFTHLFFFCFFVGVLTGMFYFYYYDIISTNPMETTENYIPFYFTLLLMKKLDYSGKIIKYSLLYTSILLQILLSTSFYFYRIIYSEYTSLTFENNSVIKLIFLFEKLIFVLLFSLMIISFTIYPKEGKLKPLIETTIFIPLNRSSFSYMNILNSTVYLFYSEYSLQVYFNYQTIILLTIGLLLVIYFTSIVFLLLVEIPFKTAYKMIFKKFD